MTLVDCLNNMIDDQSKLMVDQLKIIQDKQDKIDKQDIEISRLKGLLVDNNISF